MHLFLSMCMCMCTDVHVHMHRYTTYMHACVLARIKHACMKLCASCLSICHVCHACMLVCMSACVPTWSWWKLACGVCDGEVTVTYCIWFVRCEMWHFCNVSATGRQNRRRNGTLSTVKSRKCREAAWLVAFEIAGPRAVHLLTGPSQRWCWLELSLWKRQKEWHCSCLVLQGYLQHVGTWRGRFQVSSWLSASG